jgi:hypothetical protein
MASDEVDVHLAQEQQTADSTGDLPVDRLQSKMESSARAMGSANRVGAAADDREEVADFAALMA